MYYIKNHIERNILRRHKIIAVRQCGGELQGNAVRRLMKHGDVMCNDISNYLIDQNNNDKVGNSNDMISDEEIKATCTDHDNLFCLFDKVFSMLNRKRGSFDELTIKSYVNHLQAAFNKWNQMKLSITHKMHLLLSHAVPQIKMHKGVSYLSESRIERAHQTQTKDNDLVKIITTEDIGAV